MKNKKNTFVKTISKIVMIIAITCTTNLYAGGLQGPGGSGPALGGPGGTTDPSVTDNNTTSIPLDGGLAILLIGAAAFGIKKLRGTKSDNL